MKIRVLVADDFPLLRDAVADALDRDPAIEVVGRAADGAEALALAAQHRPHVVVLDLRMPEVCGLGVLERLGVVCPHAKALVLTATQRPDRLLQAVEAGAAGYLLKSTTPEALRQAVITVHGGGLAVEPALAGHLLRAVRGEHTRRDALTGREREILRLVARGRTDAEVAAELYLSRRTVQNHLSRVREKTGLRRRAEIGRWAGEQGWA